MILTNTRLVSCATMCALVCQAHVAVPEGTKIRVRLETNNISSATAEEGLTVELSVANPAQIGGTAVFAESARVTATITDAHEKRLKYVITPGVGRLDLSIDRVQAVDNHFALWPAAPVMPSSGSVLERPEQTNTTSPTGRPENIEEQTGIWHKVMESARYGRGPRGLSVPGSTSPAFFQAAAEGIVHK